jgi:hypothetical protein
MSLISSLYYLQIDDDFNFHQQYSGISFESCIYSDEVEDECHFLLKCSLYNKEREILLNDIHKDNQNLFVLSVKEVGS